MKKKPRHRPPNTVRIESMLRWYKTAMAEARIMDNGDFEEFYANISPKPDMTLERQMSLMLRLSTVSCIDDIEGLTEDEREVLEWMENVAEARKPISKMRTYKVAAELFNNQLKISQSHGYRLDEEPATAGAIQRAVNRYNKEKPEND
jgi:hypothetical protein